MTQSDAEIQLSVIIPVGDRHADPQSLLAEYSAGLAAVGQRYEIIFVLDGPQTDFATALQDLTAEHNDISIVSLTRPFGEATALMAGFARAAGQLIINLPAYHQIQGMEITKLVAGLDEADLVIARRWPRAGGSFEGLRRSAFHGLIASVTGQRFHDLGCGARVMRRRVLEEITLYGDQHRFLALLADRQGFRVREINVAQSALDRFTGHYRAREYAHRVLDIFTVFFLVRFTKKPLRFFGMLGVSTFVIGGALLAYLVVDRLIFNVGLADRPALLLSSLLVVLGLQLFALGLLGELIIFTHAKNIKDYQVDRVIEFTKASHSDYARRPDKSAIAN
ncbi:MAG TPA: glycosyltransferase [Steroidobacteraceae bacterium]|jgi:glycosyltransferase involved in cell wall biosynthesis|nr:glycosyltransferase [Steroidobacteraceae bacterium]